MWCSGTRSPTPGGPGRGQLSSAAAHLCSLLSPAQALHRVGRVPVSLSCLNCNGIPSVSNMQSRIQIYRDLDQKHQLIFLYTNQLVPVIQTTYDNHHEPVNHNLQVVTKQTLLKWQIYILQDWRRTGPIISHLLCVWDDLRCWAGMWDDCAVIIILHLTPGTRHR